MDRLESLKFKFHTLQFRYLSTPGQALNSMAEDADSVTKKLIKVAIIGFIIFVLLVIVVSAFNATEITWDGKVIKPICSPDG